MAVTNDYIFVWKINERPVSNKYQSKYITEIKNIGCKKDSTGDRRKIWM